MTATTITIARFDHYLQAHFIKNRLEQEGIPSFLTDEHMVTIDPMMANALGGIKLNVHHADAEEVLQLLNEWENSPYLSDENTPVQCPNCESQSLNKEYRDFKNASGIAAFLLALLTGTYPLSYQDKTQCLKCKHVF